MIFIFEWSAFQDIWDLPTFPIEADESESLQDLGDLLGLWGFLTRDRGTNGVEPEGAAGAEVETKGILALRFHVLPNVDSGFQCFPTRGEIDLFHICLINRISMSGTILRT